MCKYCENLHSTVSDFEYWNGIESKHSCSVYVHIMRDPSTNKFYFEIDEDYSSYFEISFCPKYGRKFDT